MFTEIEGDLIDLALKASFDVIAHGVNCCSIQGAGLAPQMVKIFGTDTFPLEKITQRANINKLGTIDYMSYEVKGNTAFRSDYAGANTCDMGKQLIVVNAYTQFNPGKNLDVEALKLCLRKMNYKFKGAHIGLPLLGCGIAGGIWDYDQLNKEQLIDNIFNPVPMIKPIVEKELKDCDVTIVHYKPN